MEDSSKATTRLLSMTTTKPHCSKSASLGVKVLPVPVPSNFENEIPVNFRLRTRSIAILQNANGILFLEIEKKYATVIFTDVLSHGNREDGQGVVIKNEYETESSLRLRS